MSDVPCCYCGQILGKSGSDWHVLNIGHGMCCTKCRDEKAVKASDDPAVWLVEEFGAQAYYGGDGRITVSIDGFLTYRCWDGNVTWDFENRVLKQPLTRDDVRCLCELFGVEVQR